MVLCVLDVLAVLVVSPTATFEADVSSDPLPMLYFVTNMTMHIHRSI